MLRSKFTVALLQRNEQCVERVGALEFAQVWRVGRTDVDGDVVCVRIDKLEARQIIGRGIGDINHAALADVNAEHATGMTSHLQTRRKRRRTLVIETLTIDQRAVCGQSKQTRARVARLRM